MERVVDRFPEFAALIQDRFHDDQSFREMCSDYAELLPSWLRRASLPDIRRGGGSG